MEVLIIVSLVIIAADNIVLPPITVTVGMVSIAPKVETPVSPEVVGGGVRGILLLCQMAVQPGEETQDQVFAKQPILIRAGLAAEVVRRARQPLVMLLAQLRVGTGEGR